MGDPPISQMDALLEELCTRHGWCLREAVVDSIVRAEFGDSAALDNDTRGALRAVALKHALRWAVPWPTMR